MGRSTLAVATALLLLVPGTGAAQTVNMGDTFHALEARARRVTTTFPDAVVDVQRTPDRGVEASLRPRGGGVAGRLHVASDTRRVSWHAPGASPQEFQLPDQTTISLDWAAHQLYALHEDAGEARRVGRGVDVAGENGAWDGHVRRDRRALAGGSSSGQLASRIEAVETTFEDVIVRAAIDRHEKRPSARRIDYSRFTATIIDARTGARRGFVRWFDTAQVLTWKIEGGTEGAILPERLRGGWTFTPTMGWANVQAYQFATQATRAIDEASVPFAGIARGLFERAADRPAFAQVARAIAPLPSAAAALAGTLAGRLTSDAPWPLEGWNVPWQVGAVARVNDEGCDRLHWLDGTVFRQCCDRHDRCYEKNGCAESSWFWPFAGSWSCQRCNLEAVYCFCTASNPMNCGGVGSGGGDGGSDGGGCASVAGGFCPVECQTCQAH